MICLITMKSTRTKWNPNRWTVRKYIWASVSLGQKKPGLGQQHCLSKCQQNVVPTILPRLFSSGLFFFSFALLLSFSPSFLFLSLLSSCYFLTAIRAEWMNSYIEWTVCMDKQAIQWSGCTAFTFLLHSGSFKFRLILFKLCY